MTTRVPHSSRRLLPRGKALGIEPSRDHGPILSPEGEKNGAPRSERMGHPRQGEEGWAPECSGVRFERVGHPGITGLRGRQLFHFHRSHVEEVRLVVACARGGRETWIADGRTVGVAGRRAPACGHSPQVHVELLGLGRNMILFGSDDRAIKEPTDVVRKPLHPVGMPGAPLIRGFPMSGTARRNTLS